jgi:23S rRNA pseudouridine1911/1915/1917 synthase
VNKPAPLQIHPSKPGDAGLTLWDGLRALLVFELTNGGQISLINRLDRETSGLVLVAKNIATARLFGKAMMRRQVSKSYLAIVHGWPEWENLTVEAPIIRQGEVKETKVYVRQCVHESGVPCHSEFRVQRRFERSMELRTERFSIIEATPHTGRMHQLRVHLSHCGFPVVGDKLYGMDETCYREFMDTGWTPSMQSRLWLPRQALHSHKLELETTDGRRAWTAPLTEDLEKFIAGC